MKKKFNIFKYAIIALLGVMSAYSCQSTEDLFDEGENGLEVKFRPSIAGSNPQTRLKSEAAGGVYFSHNDLVAVMKEYSTSTTAKFIYDATAVNWNYAMTSQKLLWNTASGRVNSFQGYYPTTSGTDYDNFTLPLDQSDTLKFRNADYLRGDTIYSTVPVPSYLEMNFEHQTARVKVHIVGWGSQFMAAPIIDEVRVRTNGNTYKLGSWSWPTGYSPSPSGSTAAETARLRTACYSVGTLPMKQTTTSISLYGQPGVYMDDYYALVAPTEASASTPFLYFYLKENDVPLVLTGMPKLEAGVSYTINVWLGHDEMFITSVDVTPWTPVTPITGLTATNACQVGWWLNNDGTCSKDWTSAAIALIFAVSDSYNSDNLSRDPNLIACHGRAVALEDCFPSNYGGINLSDTCHFAPTPYSMFGIANYAKDADNAKLNYNGFKNTDNIRINALTSASYLYSFSATTFPAAYAAYTYSVTAPSSTSGWYLPAAGELRLIFAEYGPWASSTTNPPHWSYLNGGTFNSAKRFTWEYWSSTGNLGKAYAVDMYNGNVSLHEQAFGECCVRPCIAF